MEERKDTPKKGQKEMEKRMCITDVTTFYNFPTRARGIMI